MTRNTPQAKVDRKHTLSADGEFDTGPSLSCSLGFLGPTRANALVLVGVHPEAAAAVEILLELGRDELGRTLALADDFSGLLAAALL